MQHERKELEKLPEYCDLLCPHARFPEQDALDGARSCRTFVAVYCMLLQRPVAKNGRCAAAPVQRGAGCAGS